MVSSKSKRTNRKTGSSQNRTNQSTKRKVIIPILIVVGLFLVIGGFWFWNRQEKQSQGTGPLVAVNSINYEFPDNHLHGLAYDDSRGIVYLATHYGLFVLKDDKSLYKLGAATDDFMGFSLHPGNPQIIFASGHPRTGGNIGVIKSGDGGVSWKRIFSGLRGESVDFHSMAISSADPNVLIGYFDGRLYVTEDGGGSWRFTFGNLPPGPCWGAPCLAFDTKERNKIYAGTQQGLFISNDLGKSWLLKARGFFGGVTVDPFNNNLMYAFGEQGIVKSGDGGSTWAPAARGVRLGGNEFVFSFSISQKDRAVLYAATTGGRVFKSENGGESWKLVY